LKTVTFLGTNVSSIEEGAFYGCSSLTSIILPDTVSTIKSSAFDDCNSLNSITIPQKVARIEHSTFSGCNNLKSVTFLGDISSIDYHAFYDCRSLTSIVLPDSVSKIDEDAFHGCKNLETVSYLGSSDPGTASSNAFSGCVGLKMICVSESYKSTSFCGRNISCRSPSCDVVSNQCFEIIDEDLKCVVRKSSYATKWEDTSNNCVEYQCNNETGIVAYPECKNKIVICVDGECIKEDTIDADWGVDVMITMTEQITPESIIIELSNSSSIDAKDITVGIEYSDDGKIKRIVVYVKDRKQADVMLEAVKSFCGSRPYERMCEEPTIRAITHELSLSRGSIHHADFSKTFATMMILVFITAMTKQDI